MPAYLYHGHNAQGQKAVGSLYAENRAQAERQLVMTEISGYEIYTTNTLFDYRPYALVKPGELAVFCEQAAAAFSSEKNPAEAFAGMAASYKNENLRTALKEISGFIMKGHTPAGAIGMYEHIFGAYLTKTAAAGEADGQLSGVMTELSDFYGRESRLPHIWRGLFLCHSARRTRFRLWLDKKLATFPIISRIFILLYTARISRGLVLILRRNLSLNEHCLRMLAGNYTVEDKINRAVKLLRSGRDFASAMESVDYMPPKFPKKFNEMLYAGYKNGNLADMMERAGHIYDRRARRALSFIKWFFICAAILTVLGAGLNIYYRIA